MAKRLKRVTATKPKMDGDYPYRLRMGTPNQLGEEQKFKSEGPLRAAIVHNLRSIHQPWLERYNVAGVKLVGEILEELSNTTITSERKRISRCIDEHYGVTVVYEFWKRLT